MDHAQLTDRFSSCAKCEGAGRDRFFSDGNGTNGIMFVFERAKLLNSRPALLSVFERTVLSDLLCLFDVDIENVYMTSLQKCCLVSPGTARNCLDFLRWQFKLLRPERIVCFGEAVSKVLIGEEFLPDRDNGSEFKKGNVLFYGVSSLETALSSDEKKMILFSDFQKIFKDYMEKSFDK